jgi:hypothetical protein
VTVSVSDNTEAERYEISQDGIPAGFIQYYARPGLIAIVHTEIDPRFEGQGLGGQLAQRVLDDARAKGLAVLPFCPFVNAYIAKHREYVELVPAEHRERFELELSRH